MRKTLVSVKTYILNWSCLDWYHRYHFLYIQRCFCLQHVSEFLQVNDTWSIQLWQFLYFWFHGLIGLVYMQTNKQISLMTRLNILSIANQRAVRQLTSFLLARNVPKRSSMHFSCSSCWDIELKMLPFKSFKPWSRWAPNAWRISWFSLSNLSLRSADHLMCERIRTLHKAVSREMYSLSILSITY